MVEHSLSPRNGRELITVEATMHRFVLAEFNTHRAFSRNSQSSRAIPVATQLDRLFDAMAYPVVWTSEKPGMSGGEPLMGTDLEDAEFLLERIAAYTFTAIDEYVGNHPEPESRLHKSLLNRPLEWFMWHTVVATSAEWQNFFDQRCTPQAQPEFAAVAYAIRDAIEKSEPRRLSQDGWHTPYVTDEERWHLDTVTQLHVSASRCAGVSYLNHDREPDVQKDLERYDKLMGGKPPHWSPLEHVARPRRHDEYEVLGNFAPHWVQLRHLEDWQ